MPSVKRENRTLVVEKVSTQQGEITVNLNLNIKIDGGDIQISTNSLAEEKINKENRKNMDFVPDEKFDFEMPILAGFGKQVD